MKKRLTLDNVKCDEISRQVTKESLCDQRICMCHNPTQPNSFLIISRSMRMFLWNFQ